MQADANAGQIIVSNADGLRNVEILTSPNDRGVAQLGKYWVLTNLFDSPYVYNLTSKIPDKYNAKQDTAEQQQQQQQFILGETQSIPISSNQISIPSSVISNGCPATFTVDVINTVLIIVFSEIIVNFVENV